MRVLPLRIVLACMHASIAVSLAACVSPPTQEARSMPAEARSAPPPATRGTRGPGDVPMELRKFDVQSRDGNVTFRVGDLHCAEPSHPLHGRYPDCNGIPVVVLDNPKGGCIAVIPYANLIIHSQKKRTRVVWQITGGSDYEFDRSQDGIPLFKSKTDPTLPSRNYDRKQHQGDKWKWELHEEALYPKTFYHFANVVDKRTGTACEPIDPGMINVIN